MCSSLPTISTATGMQALTIAKALKADDKTARFIARTADVHPERWQRGNKTQITLSISPGLLKRVDEVARQKEVSRAALLTIWIGDALARGAA
jgi:hypothetical protein